MSDRVSLIERDLMVQAVAAYLPGAVRRERVENMLRALDAAGYQVVPKSGHPQGAVEDRERLSLALSAAVNDDHGWRAEALKVLGVEWDGDPRDLLRGQ